MRRSDGLRRPLRLHRGHVVRLVALRVLRESVPSRRAMPEVTEAAGENPIGGFDLAGPSVILPAN